MLDADEHTHPMTVARAASLIRAQFPELAELDVVQLGEGTDHWAFEVGERYVFRFPKSQEAADTLAVEARLTTWLAPRLPLALPSYRFFGQANDDAPRSFAGYAKLAGTPALLVDPDTMDPRATGHGIGDFLRTLHGMDITTAGTLGLPADDDPTLEAWSAVALADLDFAAERGHLESTARAHWERALATRPATTGRSYRVIHGDLAAEHVLLDDHGAPAAVIDWSDAAIGDPALDLGGVMHWGGERLLSLVRETYGAIDDVVLERARWFAACRAFADIVFGEERQRPEYVMAGQRALSWLGPWLP
jgi:aminoglycoside phosphotransferase (APT) family kinase protein